MGFLPGVNHPKKSPVGSRACVYKQQDTEWLSESMASNDFKNKLWAGYQSPLQNGPHGSDLAVDIHSGEAMLNSPIAASQATIVVHGQFDSNKPLKKKKPKNQTVYYSTGTLLPKPSPKGAAAEFLILDVSNATPTFEHFLFSLRQP